MGAIADTATDGDTVALPPVSFQPVAADDVASAVARTAAGDPLNGIVDIPGPERGRFDEMVGRVLAFRNDPRTVVADPDAPYFGAHMDEKTLVPEEDGPTGETTLATWLAAPGQ